MTRPRCHACRTRPADRRCTVCGEHYGNDCCGGLHGPGRCEADDIERPLTAELPPGWSGPGVPLMRAARRRAQES